jgi:hypothetical protein
MNPHHTAPISATFTFAHPATGTPKQRYALHTLRIQGRNNSVEIITIVTSITGVLIAAFTLTFMGYKHWRKTKRDVSLWSWLVYPMPYFTN